MTEAPRTKVFGASIFLLERVGVIGGVGFVGFVGSVGVVR